jgi:enamine deaminase RidA (YjgF/YER057c/UK114 family)
MPVERISVPEVFDVASSSHAVSVDGHLYLGGFLPTVGPTLELATGGIEGQTREVIRNLEHALAGCGASLDDLVKVTVYLADIAQFLAMDAVYGELIQSKPVRTTIGAGALSLGALVEIDGIACKPG